MNKPVGLFLFVGGSAYCTLEQDELNEFLKVNNLQTTNSDVNGSQNIFENGVLIGYVM